MSGYGTGNYAIDLRAGIHLQDSKFDARQTPHGQIGATSVICDWLDLQHEDMGEQDRSLF